MKDVDVFRAARNVVGRQTVAGGSVAVALASDDPLIRWSAVCVLALNALADFVIELRTRKALNGTTAAPVSPLAE